MNWWRRLTRAFGFRRKAAAPIWAELSQSSAAFGAVRRFPRQGTGAILRLYETNGWLRAVVDLVSFEVAMARFRAYKSVDGMRPHLERRSIQRKAQVKALVASRELIEVPGHEVLRLLAMPGAELSGLAALRLLQSHLDLAGECFLQLRREGGRVVGFSVIPPNAIIALPTTDAPVYEISYGSVQRGMVPASEVVHIKHPSPYDPSARGVGLGHTLGDELQVNEFVSESLRSVFARGGMPTTLVSVAGADQNQDSQDIAEDLQKRFGGEIVGPAQQGKILVLPGKITSTVVNADLKQLAVVEIQKYVQDFVRQVFAVPPEILGDLSSSNRSTSEAAEYHLQAYAVLPRLEFLVAELNHKLVPLIDSSVVLDFDDPRPQATDLVVSLMSNGNTAHSFTINEVRALAGLGPIEGGEARLLPPPGSKPAGTPQPVDPEVVP